MGWNKDHLIPENEISEKVTDATIMFAKDFGFYLAESVKDPVKNRVIEEALTTNQLRKFFGEVKRQQLSGYDQTAFAMLKPKLAYAAGRAHKDKKKYKIDDFYFVLSDAIDKVNRSADKNKAFKNFISVFEAIVAYHKAAENKVK